LKLGRAPQCAVEVVGRLRPLDDPVDGGLVGGHAGGLNPGGGKHIVANNAAHPAQALISAMKAVGVAEETETLGEVSGAIPELFA